MFTILSIERLPRAIPRVARGSGLAHAPNVLMVVRERKQAI